MHLRSALLTSVSVIGFAVAAPAMAQTIINPQQATGSLVQGSGGSVTQDISTTATGLTALAAGNQSNNNAINLIGNGSSALAVSTNFGFGQVIGGITGPDATTSFNQGSSNSIGAASSTTLQSNVTAALSGGNQSATNAANSATFSLLTGSTGSLTQAVNTSTAGSVDVMAASNSISASAVNGQASILGNGFGQVANNSLNSAAFVAAGTATIGLDQKAPTGTINASQTNTASAQVTFAGNPVIDPSITNLSQTAGFSLNSISGQGASNALTLTNGSDNAGQSAAFVAGATISSYNTSVASTGFFAPGNGAAQISGSSQANSLSLNRIANAGTTSFGDLAGQFTQSVDTSNLAASGLRTVVYGLTNQVSTGGPTANLMVASTGAGAASVTGTPLGATNSTATQYRTVELNSIASGGLVSGTLDQRNATAITLAQMPALNNVAAARTDIGAATVSSVSQAQVQSLNTLSGGGASGLNATQNATAVNFGGENRQNAVTGLGVATISGGLQQMGSSVNVASLGALGAGSVLQSTAAVTQNTANSLTATGGAAIASGSQTVTNTTNAIR